MYALFSESGKNESSQVCLTAPCTFKDVRFFFVGIEDVLTIVLQARHWLQVFSNSLYIITYCWQKVLLERFFFFKSFLESTLLQRSRISGWHELINKVNIRGKKTENRPLLTTRMRRPTKTQLCSNPKEEEVTTISSRYLDWRKTVYIEEIDDK